MALSTDDIYARALDQAKDDDDNFLELAKTLRQLHDRDPELIKKVMAKTGLGSRKAYYLINIDNWFSGLQVSKARLKKLGWTKLQLIGAGVTQDNVEELLTLAENSTAAQLKQITKGDEAVNNARCVLLYFSPKEYDHLETVLLANGGTKSGRGIVDKEKALLKAISPEGVKVKMKG